MSRLVATETHFKNVSVGHSFIAIEAVNHGLSTENFVVTFSEFLIFNENAVSSFDFIYFLKFSDF